MNQDGLVALLPGTWYVQATNFPMWLTGKKLKPTFTYTLINGAPLRLNDDVGYIAKNGVQKHMVGVDTFDNDTNEFIWRGSGLLKLFTSRWSVIYMHPDGAFAIISFSKSLATPPGIDIITKKPTIDAKDKQFIQSNPTFVGLDATKIESLGWLAQ